MLFIVHVMFDCPNRVFFFYHMEKLHPVMEKVKMEILCLTLDPKGNCSQHIQAIASDARKRLGAIRRMSHMLDDKSIMRACKAFVSSKIEYGSLAYWGAAESYI